MSLPTVTPFERQILVEGIVKNDFFIESGWAWTDTVADYARVSPSQMRGALSSLKSKGLVETDGNVGRDACIRPTDLGLKVAKA